MAAEDSTLRGFFQFLDGAGDAVKAPADDLAIFEVILETVGNAVRGRGNSRHKWGGRDLLIEPGN
jgi:hypothetical protein